MINFDKLRNDNDKNRAVLERLKTYCWSTEMLNIYLEEQL